MQPVNANVRSEYKDGVLAQELHQNGAVLVLRYLFERQLANFDFGRLPPEQISDRRETLAKRVSDDLQHFIFRRREKKLAICFAKQFSRKIN